jgi:hypothetical protein
LLSKDDVIVYVIPEVLRILADVRFLRYEFLYIGKDLFKRFPIFQLFFGKFGKQVFCFLILHKLDGVSVKICPVFVYPFGKLNDFTSGKYTHGSPP